MMKIFFYLTLLIFALGATVSCSTGENSSKTTLENAEQAFQNRRYNKAQQLADSIINSGETEKMSSHALCRLALLFMRLAETTGEEEANAALAVRTLQAAMACDSDSTVEFLRSVADDDRSRVQLMQAISNAFHGTTIEGDTVYFEYDSIY